jgi:hypothetical protein
VTHLATSAALLMGDLLTCTELQRRLLSQIHPALPFDALDSNSSLLGKQTLEKLPFSSLSNHQKNKLALVLFSKEMETLFPASMLLGNFLAFPSSPSTQLSTDGIDMEQWSPPVSDGAPVSFNVFDFAGPGIHQQLLWE